LNKLKVNLRIFEFLLKIFLWVLDPFFLAINIFLFVRLLLRKKPSSVLVCNGGYPAARACLAMCIASRILGIPVVLSIVSMPSKRRILFSLYEKILDLLIWNSVSKVIVNAKAIAKELAAFRGMPLSKFIVIHNGLDDKPYVKSSGPFKNKIVIGYVGRIDKSKGIFYLFDAFLTLLDRYPNLELVLVGNGDSFAEIFHKVSDLGLDAKIKLPGHFEGEISSVLANFDIYAFPSLWEGFPYSILEAMRSGCAIVSTDVGGVSEAVENGVDGMLVNPGSSQSLIVGLEKLIEDTEFRTLISSNARTKFCKKFTLTEMAVASRKVLKEI
jgi:glycosyltransferase involved in cell wall biosynthesis